MTYATRLRTHLTAAGLTPAQLAAKLGVSRTTIHRFLSGENKPGWELACRIADALGKKIGAFR